MKIMRAALLCSAAWFHTYLPAVASPLADAEPTVIDVDDGDEIDAE